MIDSYSDNVDIKKIDSEVPKEMLCTICEKNMARYDIGKPPICTACLEAGTSLKEPNRVSEIAQKDIFSATDSKQGKKADIGKLRYDLIPVKAMAEIVKILTYGAKKYAPRDWERGMLFSRYYGALQRHLSAWWGGEDNDLETGISHLAHAGSCVLFLLHYSLWKRAYACFDDRPDQHMVREDIND